MDIHSNNQNSLTLHIRLTKKCNADCSYCSSYETYASEKMSLENLDKSLEFLTKFIDKYNMGGTRKMLTVQYVGGEISTLPTEYIEQFTGMVKNKLSPLFQDFKHGAQSNLIASQHKLDKLIDIFDSNIGTSIDNFTKQRTLKKDSNKYKTIFLKNLTYTKKAIGQNISGILVIDKKMYPYVQEEIKIAEQKRMSMTLRPVFMGGSPVESLSIEQLENLYSEIFDNWFMKSNIAIEPHYSLFKKRFLKYKNNTSSLSSVSGCPFQHSCATSSINLEPNGDLYVCLDMADSKHYVFGNSITGFINEDVFNTLLERTKKLNSDCIHCPYFDECQGGCMNEAIEHTGDIFGKTSFCQVWKRIFYKIDSSLQKYNIEDVDKWIAQIS